ncbi:MAG: ABC transporter permease [Planctomycetota bacterium]
MRLPPLSYNVRSLFVRWSSTLLTVIGIGATVAVLSGVLALQQGFSRLYTEGGRADTAIFLRPGATNESESAIQREQAQILIKETPEIVRADDGQALAAGEIYLAVRQRKVDGGGETNVAIRGVQPPSFEIAGVEIVEGRRFELGNDEVVIGQSLVGRIQNCKLGGEIQLNTSPFKVVGIFRSAGPAGSEIWGDVDRLGPILERPNFSRVVARVQKPEDVAAIAARLDGDKRIPAKVISERAYLSAQTLFLSATLVVLGTFLAVVMGAAAVFSGMNTMLAALASRTSEIGVLLALGFRPFAIFLGFVFESLVLGLLGGVAGVLMALPLHGVRTGTTNFQTFTEVAFAFQITPPVLVVAVGFSMILGLVGGALPAFRAARMEPCEALRHR